VREREREREREGGGGGGREGEALDSAYPRIDTKSVPAISPAEDTHQIHARAFSSLSD